MSHILNSSPRLAAVLYIDSYRRTLALSDLEKYTKTAFSTLTIMQELNCSLVSYFICEDTSSTPRGYAKLILSEPTECINTDEPIELQRLYVNENYPGQGMGGLLERHCEQDARNRHMNSIWLRVWNGNKQSLNLYQRWGYTIVGEAQ